MNRAGALLSLVPAALALTACTRGLESRSFAWRVIPAASPDAVFMAAQVALRREFGPLDVDREARRLVTRPVEFRTSSESGTVRDLYGAHSTMRRIAHFTVGRRGDGAIAGLRIDIQRLDTDRQEVFRPDRHRLTDAPSETPIERDAATSTRQNTVWTFVKRDRRSERALLAELQERFAPPPEETEAAPSAEDRPAEAP